MRTAALLGVLVFLVVGWGCQSDNSSAGTQTMTMVVPEGSQAVTPPPAPEVSPPTGQIYDVGDVAVQPVSTYRAMPHYPTELRRHGITGHAVIEFVVTSRGRVVGAQIVRATDPAFGVAALESVRQWRFIPGKVDGHPVNCRMQVPIVFELNG